MAFYFFPTGLLYDSLIFPIKHLKINVLRL